MRRTGLPIAVLLVPVAVSVGGAAPSAATTRARMTPQPRGRTESASQTPGRQGAVTTAAAEVRSAEKGRKEARVSDAAGDGGTEARGVTRLALRKPAWLSETVKPETRVLRLDRLEAVTAADGTQRTQRREIEVTEEELTPPGLRWHGDLSLGIGTDDTWDSRVRLWTTIRDGVHLGFSAGIGRHRWPARDSYRH